MDTETCDRTGPRSLLLNGPSGIGESSTLGALGRLLATRHIPHALIDLDHLTLSWPRPEDDPWGGRIARANLELVASTYRRAGVKRIAVAHVFTELEFLDGCRAALGEGTDSQGPTIPLVRLRASPVVVADRLRARHAHDAPWELEGFLAGQVELAEALERAGLDDVVIDVGGLSPLQVAEKVADAVGW